jgi:ribA/ribD-fused uncharacterized protein
MKAILEFRGKYRFLSNFYPCRITFDGAQFMSVENAYQAAKVPPWERSPFTRCTPGLSKRLSRVFALPSDWDLKKEGYMISFLDQKFASGTRLAGLLVATGDATIVEGNTWGDAYWGVCGGVGKNRLGELLMAKRSRLLVEKTYSTNG